MAKSVGFYYHIVVTWYIYIFLGTSVDVFLINYNF